jgi:hypothetical protein
MNAGDTQLQCAMMTLMFPDALPEYRKNSGDEREFVELEPAIQHEILKRAQGLAAVCRNLFTFRRPIGA